MKRYRIGLEVHVQLKTKNKLFTSAENHHSNDANTSISYFDLGVPGVFPFINKYAIEKGIQLSNLLNCKKPDFVVFDRKHYLYPDLPLGYQITQKDYPIGINGKYRILNKDINIIDVHLSAY